MKKAKLMLSVLGITALLSTEFAFRVDKFSAHYIYTGKLKSGSCTTKVNGAAILSGKANVAASTVLKTAKCPDVYTVTIPD